MFPNTFNTENVGTFNLIGETVVVNQNDGIRNISILLVSGTVTVQGVMTLGGNPSQAIELVLGEPLNLSFDFTIDGLAIDATSGQAKIITGR
jgi:hypothetical protein